MMAPELTAVAPLVYVAWADGALGDEQVRVIRDLARRRFDGEPARALDAWLDPDVPPTATELARLHRFIRGSVGQLRARERGSLVDVGLQLATAHHDGADLQASRRGLEEMEQALGIAGRETARHYFQPRPPVRQDFVEPDPPFSVEAMTVRLDGARREVWQSVRALVQTPPFSIEPGRTQPEQRRAVRRWLREVASAGFGELGSGGGPGTRFISVLEAFGMHDLSLVVKLGVQFGLFGGAISSLGNPTQHERYLPAIARAELLGGFAMTELGHGSNVRDLETVAHYDPEPQVFVLHTPSLSARKEWIGNAAEDGTMMVVFAQLSTGGEQHGIHAFVVPIRDEQGKPLPGVHIEDCGPKMGLAGVDNGRLWFDHVQVPRENLLDRFATVDEAGTYDSPIVGAGRRFFTMLGTLVAGRIGVASAAVTSSKVALTTAVRYGALRRQFGPEGRAESSILDYPVHQQRLLPRVAGTFAYHFAVEDLQRRYGEQGAGESEEADRSARELETRAAGIKAMATWHAIDAIQIARECCGGMGFLSVNRISQIRRDVDVFATFEGDNTVLLQLVARGLLTGFAKQLSDDLMSTVLGEVARRAKAALVEQNPLARRRTEREHLLDPGFHADALAFRADNLLVSGARRFHKRTEAGIDPFEAFNEIQDHLMALARAHVEQTVHTAFVEAVDATEDEPLAAALSSLCRLWGLWRIRDDIAWFLESGYVDGRKARAIRKQLAHQCMVVREHAVALVDGFGIPDAMLGPIAFEQYTEQAALARRAAAPQ